jgi:hypothetical protein
VRPLYPNLLSDAWMQEDFCRTVKELYRSSLYWRLLEDADPLIGWLSFISGQNKNESMLDAAKFSFPNRAGLASAFTQKNLSNLGLIKQFQESYPETTLDIKIIEGIYDVTSQAFFKKAATLNEAIRKYYILSTMYLSLLDVVNALGLSPIEEKIFDSRWDSREWHHHS